MSPSWFHLFAYISHTGALQVIRLSRTSASLLSCAQNDKTKKKKRVHVQTTTKVRVPERIKNRKHLQRVTSQIVIANLPLAGVHSGVAERWRSPRDGGSSSYELNLTFLQKISSRSQQHQLWWSWSCPLGSVPQGRWLWFQPACGWRSVRAWSGSVCREKKRKSALAYFCPDCKQILVSNQ